MTHRPYRLFRGILVLPVRRFLLLASCAAIVMAAAALYRFQRQTDVFFLHSASELYPRYASLLSSPGRLPADSAAVDSASILALRKLFDDFYVVKDGATDCSFVASLMLMLWRDPLYPFRIVRETPDGYAVRFPALAAPIAVTREDLRVHHDNWKKTRETASRFWGGHIPDGLEILRAAYYNYQAQVGIRGRKGMVHGGGFPSQDLIVLSGARTSLSLVAHCPGSSSYGASFESCPAVLRETRLREDGTFSSTVKGPRRQMDNPLEVLGNQDTHLVVVASSINVPGWWGPRIVPNHAYYYLGKGPDGSYVLGNSYQTRRPIVVTPKQFRKHFRALDFLDLSDPLASQR